MSSIPKRYELLEDTSNAIPALEKLVQDLMQHLERYVTNVKAEKERIAELYRLMEKIEAEQAKQIEDYRKEREELQRQMQILLKVIEEKDKVLEEKDKDMRQLKDARAAAERMVSWGKPRVNIYLYTQHDR
ncbi:golgin subfamily A member 1-like isoform X6 [Haliotis rubra]|uniref:golgin subfamily A member 1-like isoform X6 n=1 Tax=Haliotis rubra TaxID=36100 RepID=UPI001EE6265F|nr:golgin subfamily A member 1-like isoform X6 [Haliotis rubra]